MRDNLAYVQWYPYKFKRGFTMVCPTEKQIEQFYDCVRVSDPEHESFVILIKAEDINYNINLIDEFLKDSVFPFLFR